MQAHQKKGSAYIENVVSMHSEGRARDVKWLAICTALKEYVSDLRAFRRKGARHSEEVQPRALIKRKGHRARVRRNIRFEANISENKANKTGFIRLFCIEANRRILHA